MNIIQVVEQMELLVVEIGKFQDEHLRYISETMTKLDGGEVSLQEVLDRYNKYTDKSEEYTQKMDRLAKLILANKEDIYVLPGKSSMEKAAIIAAADKLLAINTQHRHESQQIRQYAVALLMRHGY